MALCDNCGVEISAERKAAVPEERWCRQCVEEAGDVERIKGVMLWHHKTAPELFIGPGVDQILAEQRRGPHAQVNFVNRENAFVLKTLESKNVSEGLNLKDRLVETVTRETVNRPAARCHPDRPRINPRGECYECALKWYADRRRPRK